MRRLCLSASTDTDHSRRSTTTVLMKLGFALAFSPPVPSLRARMPRHQHRMVLNSSTSIPVDTDAQKAIIVGRRCRRSCRWSMILIHHSTWRGEGRWGGLKSRVHGDMGRWTRGVTDREGTAWTSLESLKLARGILKRGMRSLPS